MSGFVLATTKYFGVLMYDEVEVGFYVQGNFIDVPNAPSRSVSHELFEPPHDYVYLSIKLVVEVKKNFSFSLKWSFHHDFFTFSIIFHHRDDKDNVPLDSIEFTQPQNQSLSNIILCAQERI